MQNFLRHAATHTRYSAKFRSLEQIELATIIAKEFPEAKRKVFDVFDDYFAVTLGDDSRAGGFLKKLSFASKVANVANRAQDRAIKSAGLMTELDNQVKTAIRRGEITDPKVKGIIAFLCFVDFPEFGQAAAERNSRT